MSSILNLPEVGPGAISDVYKELAEIGAKTFSTSSPQDKAANSFWDQYYHYYERKKKRGTPEVTSNLPRDFAVLQKAHEYEEEGRVEVLFKDAYKVVRTKAPLKELLGKHHQIQADADLRPQLEHARFQKYEYHRRKRPDVPLPRGPVSTVAVGGVCPDEGHWHGDGEINTSNMTASFRPLWKVTVVALERYVDNDQTGFGQAVLANPEKILSDLLERLTYGPLFDAQATNHIVTGIQKLLERGAGKRDVLFRLGVEVIANNLLTAFNTPHPDWNYHEIMDRKTDKAMFEASLVHSTKFIALPDVFRNFDIILQPPLFKTIELNVYANALFSAMLVEGALKAAHKVDASNERHVQHVIFGINMGFAALSAVFASVPLGTGAGVLGLLEPIKEFILVKARDGYATGVISAGIERLAKRICSRATEGTIVPGLEIGEAGRNGESTFDPLPSDAYMKAIMKERMYWGDEFVKHFNVIRGFA